MTGSEIKKIREVLGLEVFAFASILGVHVSTLYRWEQSKDEVGMDPLQRSVLEQLAKKLRAKRAGEKKAIGAAVAATLLVGGAIGALATLLVILSKEDPRMNCVCQCERCKGLRVLDDGRGHSTAECGGPHPEDTLIFEIRVLQAGDWVSSPFWSGWTAARQQQWGTVIPRFQTERLARSVIQHLRAVEGEAGPFGILNLKTREVTEVPEPR